MRQANNQTSKKPQQPQNKSEEDKQITWCVCMQFMNYTWKRQTMWKKKQANRIMHVCVYMCVCVCACMRKFTYQIIRCTFVFIHVHILCYVGMGFSLGCWVYK